MTAPGERIFGTDGIRGRAGSGWLAPDAVRRIGRALGIVLAESKAGGPREVLLGHDGRHSAAMIRDDLRAGLAAAGFTTVDAGLLTTPALAVLTRRPQFAAGVMISASHNPADDNGIKAFAQGGDKIPDAAEARIEEILRRDAGVPPAASAPHPAPVPEILDDYVALLVRQRFADLDLRGMRIAVDCAHGGGSRIAPRVLRTLGAQLEVLNDQPDGHNINDGCGALHPEALARAVVARGCRFGLCLDGDGDRSILVDERGQVVDGDGVLAVTGIGLLGRQRLPGRTVVATVMSNLGLDKAIEGAGGRVVRTAVGDRAVVKAMREGGYELGGEQSGHIIFGAEHWYIGDGIYTGLRVLEEMRRGDAPLSALAAAFERAPQVLVNVEVAGKPPLESLPEVQAAMAVARQELGRSGRIVVRYSGTENLCRVMLEGEPRERIDRHATAIAAAIRRAIG